MRPTRCLHVVATFALLAGGARAQLLQVTSATRDYSAIATGFDYEFDDGVGSTGSTAATAGPWLQEHVHDLTDYRQNEVSSVLVRHDSDLGPGGVRADLRALGVALGGLHYTDGWSETGLDVAFTAPAQVRYRLRVAATTTAGGYAVAEARLSGASGSVLNVFVHGGGGDEVEQRGWLPAGAWDLTAGVQAVAIGGSGTSQLAETTLALDLQLVHAADWDADGDVAFADLLGFRREHAARSRAADFDGDGDTDRADRDAFHAAWRAAR